MPRRRKTWGCKACGARLQNADQYTCLNCGAPRPKIKTGRKGSVNERKSRDYLIGKGFTVIKAGASLGAFDLVAYDASEVWFIQVKTNGTGSPAEREAMVKTLVPINGRKFLHIWHDGAPKPEIRELRGSEGARRVHVAAVILRLLNLAGAREHITGLHSPARVDDAEALVGYGLR